MYLYRMFVDYQLKENMHIQPYSIFTMIIIGQHIQASKFKDPLHLVHYP